MKNLRICGVTAAMVLSLACVSGMHAAAYTADDVAAKARAAGWPEYLIQMGYNQWSSGSYTQEQVDKAYASVTAYDAETEELVCNMLGVDPPQESPAPTEAPKEEQQPPQEQQQNDTPAPTEAPTVVKADGTVEERIAPADFINMSLEEKQAYVDSLSPESKQAFVDSLTREERNSMLKQLPADQKAEIIQKYIDAADTMGLNVTVDSIDTDGIVMTVRDEEGVVVDKASVGTVIDETGLSHTKPIAAAAGGALLAIAGFAGLYCYIRKTE